LDQPPGFREGEDGAANVVPEGLDVLDHPEEDLEEELKDGAGLLELDHPEALERLPAEEKELPPCLA